MARGQPGSQPKECESVTSSRPNLSVLTPEPTPPPPPAAFLDRCTEVGLLAFQFAATLNLVASSRQPAGLSAVLRGPEIAELVHLRLLKAAETGARVTQETLFPGCQLGIIAHRAGPLPAGFTVVVFLAPAALEHTSFQAGCASVGLSADALRAEAAPFLREEGSDANLVLRTLLGSALDIETIEEQKVALDGFTVQLTDSYDTMDLLYSVGRSMREPFKPEQFLNFVVGRLFAARSFRWIAVVFSPGNEVAAGLRNSRADRISSAKRVLRWSRGRRTHRCWSESRTSALPSGRRSWLSH